VEWSPGKAILVCLPAFPRGVNGEVPDQYGSHHENSNACKAIFCQRCRALDEDGSLIRQLPRCPFPNSWYRPWTLFPLKRSGKALNR